jgi:hypothetical protein
MIQWLLPVWAPQATSEASLPPITIKPDDDANTDIVTYMSHLPKHPPSPATLQIDLDTIMVTKFTKSLKDMNGVELAKLLFNIIAAKPTVPTLADSSIIPLQPALISTASPTNPLAPTLLSSMSMEIFFCRCTMTAVLYCSSALVTRQLSNSKMHWTAEEIHCVIGC